MKTKAKSGEPAPEKGQTVSVCCGRLVRPLRRVAKIRKGLYNYRAYNLYRTKREWVILGEDNDAYEYGPTRLALMLLIDRWESRPNKSI